ncbi:MAG: phage tail protein [Chitinophaga sp.]|uniref:phage tail protein n=1 Tax=Chitinophaga sp. TaxID=1869181 RepID=UPI001B0E3604|nr:tail fiber protein [Chitinophaga sp.]MBO9731413.1 phage tail protein [Chitinophaga sp.]
MSTGDPFVGEIIMFGGNFAPQNFAFCSGQLLPISSNTALFSILGSTYGGDGKSTFGLPDLQAKVPIGVGQGQGLTSRDLGETAGVTDVTLTIGEMPAHSHIINKRDLAFPVGVANDTHNPVGHYPGVAATTPLYALKTANVGMLPDIKPVLKAAQSGYQTQSFTNMQSTVPITFLICLYGIFPPRT